MSASSLLPDQTLAEAEDALGRNDGLDPESGAPADGETPPRLPQE